MRFVKSEELDEMVINNKNGSVNICKGNFEVKGTLQKKEFMK